MFTREGITALYEDAKDLKEVAVFADDCLGLANTVESHLNQILGHDTEGGDGS